MGGSDFAPSVTWIENEECFDLRRGGWNLLPLRGEEQKKVGRKRCDPGALADEAVGVALLHLTRRLQETGNPRATLDEAKELFQHSLDRL